MRRKEQPQNEGVGGVLQLKTNMFQSGVNDLHKPYIGIYKVLINLIILASAK